MVWALGLFSLKRIPHKLLANFLRCPSWLYFEHQPSILLGNGRSHQVDVGKTEALKEEDSQQMLIESYNDGILTLFYMFFPSSSSCLRKHKRSAKIQQISAVYTFQFFKAPKEKKGRL
ncbi:hypothetical protein SCA6_001481 [Theobroma cacao]